MAYDFWRFTNAKEIEHSSLDLPDSIIKSQMNLLGEKTNFVLYGKPVVAKVDTYSGIKEYEIATFFNVIVPKLDDYSKTLFIMYSNPQNIYPIAITVGSNYIDDCDDFKPKYTCQNKEHFLSALEEILSSPEVTTTIQLLYSKASMLS